ncbi:MAG: hypothetical protein ACI4VN_01890 [Clostridia bacterium]
MERKDYLEGSLTKEEKSYLKKIILNTRRKYIRDNYDFINDINVDLCDYEDIEAESVLEAVINKCEKEIESAVEFEKVISNNKLYKVIKALSLKEKMMLFSLYKEDKPISLIATEMKISRTTAWRIKTDALDKVMKALIGGGDNV